MVKAQQQDYEGWNIYTMCDEARPLDWGPGRPLIYAVRGFAEYTRPADYKPGYDDVTRIDVPPQDNAPLHFFDFNRAHEHVVDALKKTIDNRARAE